MALRARKPEAIEKRLKMFMFGPAGVGKTTAVVQFPRSYIIDAERGAENYAGLIRDSGSVVFPTNDVEEAVTEIRSLLTEKHDFRTLVIDPITPLYDDLLEKCEKRVGSDFGRHYGEANKTMKRLFNLILTLDMNVIVTAHAKTEYGENLTKLGFTFDGWKKLDYMFDLVVELQKRGKGEKSARVGMVRKTRLDQFADGSTFDWSYKDICTMYGREVIERPAEVVTLASADQVSAVKSLIETVRLPEGTVEKWFTKAGVEDWEDMSADAIGKCIDYVRSKLPAAPAAA